MIPHIQLNISPNMDTAAAASDRSESDRARKASKQREKEERKRAQILSDIVGIRVPQAS